MYRSQPHSVAPTKQTARLLICYKSFAAKHISHVGLGVAGLVTSRTLRQHGYWADTQSVTSAADIEQLLQQARNAANRDGQHMITHLVISAPWIPTPELQGLLTRWPNVHFAVVSHSNVGFLQADPNGIRLLREAMGLSIAYHNMTVAGNSSKFVEAWTTMYGRGMAFLPNLYDVSTIKPVGQRVPWHPGAPLRIGVFGATRPLKNMVSAVACCVELSSALRADVEVWMNTGRNEGGGTTSDAVKQLTAGLPQCKIVEAGWQSWPDFRLVVGRMNLLISPSYTESFCMVVADGAAEGVASVTSDAIDWTPSDWQANADNVNSMTRIARRLLNDAHAVTDGQAALRSYVERGLPQWEHFLV